MKIIKPKGYWKVKENCIASAKEYRIRSEWKVSCSGAYEHARRYGWLDECCKHMTRSPHKPHGYWTKERCIEDAKNYKMRSEWKKNSGRAVALARKNGFFDECISHMKIKKYQPKGIRIIDGLDSYEESKSIFDKVVSGEIYIDEVFRNPDNPLRNIVMLLHIDEPSLKRKMGG